MEIRTSLLQLTCILGVLLCFQSLGTNGAKSDRMTPYTSTKGKPCISPCERRGGIEYWCNVGKSRAGFIYDYDGWDNCSPNDGVTYKGDMCTLSCRSHKDYFFCYTDYKLDKWDYCGPIENDYTAPILNQHYTCKGVPCISECKFHPGEDKSRCDKAGGSWGHCSVKPGDDIKGRKCDSKCAYSDDKTSQWFTYTWCWLNEEAEEWNYCGKVNFAEIPPVAAAYEYTTNPVVKTTDSTRKTTTARPPDATHYEYNSLPEIVADSSAKTTTYRSPVLHTD